VNSLDDSEILAIVEVEKAGIWSTADVPANIVNKLTDQTRKHLRTHIRNNATEVRRIMATTGWEFLMEREAPWQSEPENIYELKILRRELERSEMAGVVDRVDMPAIPKLSDQELHDRLKISRDDPEYVRIRRQYTSVKEIDRLTKETDKRFQKARIAAISHLTAMRKVMQEVMTTMQVNAKDREQVQGVLWTIGREIEDLSKMKFQVLENETEDRAIERYNKRIQAECEDLIAKIQELQPAIKREKLDRLVTEQGNGAIGEVFMACQKIASLI
jgi:DNA-directed RNA polymerase subunit L